MLLKSAYDELGKIEELDESLDFLWEHLLSLH